MMQGPMMQGEMWGSGWMSSSWGLWGPICLIAIVAIFVVWIIIQRKGK